MAGEKRQITRNRVSYSCQKCRQRKVKCDKVHPICGACQKTGEECVYTSTENEQHAHVDGNVAEAASAKKRKQSPTELPHENNERDGVSQGASNVNDQLSKLSLLLNQLSDVAGVKIAPPNNSRNGILTPESYKSNHVNTALVKESGSSQYTPDSNHVRTTDEQHHGPNLDNISTQLEQLTNLLSTQRFDLPNPSVHERDTAQNENGSRSQQPTGHGMSLRIPSEQQRSALFRCWLSSVYPVLPIVDPHLALMKYRAFHFWYTYGLEKGTPNPCEDYVPLIFAIYYAGIVSLSLRGFRKWFPGASRQEMLASMRTTFLYTLKAPSRLLSSSGTLAARVIFRYVSAPDRRDVDHISTVAPLVRGAYSANLHRERPNESLDAYEAELNRRLWWEIVMIDTLEATGSHMPPSINHHFSDIYMSSEMKDTKLGTPEAVRYLSELTEGRSPDKADDPSTNERSSMTSVINLVAKARTILASSARRLLNINLAAKPKTKEDMMEIKKSLEEVDHFIKSIIDRIPAKGLPEMSFSPNSNKPGQSVSLDHVDIFGSDLLSCEVELMCGFHPKSDHPQMPYVMQYRTSLLSFHKYARILLSMSVDQLHCFSYSPFLSNAKRKIWVSARQCALRHAHSCIRKFNALASDIELERFRWTWPVMYHPVHACLIILLDTYEQPKSREASRSRALLDEMLSLSSPEFGIVGGLNGITNNMPLQESGIEAFTMLLQLRAKAWHKAGLDPLLLWTEQDQIDIGVATPLTEADKMVQSMREDIVLHGTSESSSDQTLNLFRMNIQQRAQERFHPADMGPPDEADTLAPTTWVKDIESIEKSRPKTSTHFRRARPDQKPVSTTLLAYMNPSRIRAGYAYKYQLPSSLYDMGALIEKIKSYQQQSNKSKTDANNDNSATNEDPSALSQQLATKNNDLTDFLAEAFPNSFSKPPANTNSLKDVVDPNPSSNPFSTANTAKTNNPLLPSYPHPPPTTTTSNPNLPDPATSTTNADTKKYNGNGEKDNDENNDEAAPLPTEMDFDWDKWDAIFGHILDDDEFVDVASVWGNNSAGGSGNGNENGNGNGNGGT